MWKDAPESMINDCVDVSLNRTLAGRAEPNSARAELGGEPVLVAGELALTGCIGRGCWCCGLRPASLGSFVKIAAARGISAETEGGGLAGV